MMSSTFLIFISMTSMALLCNYNVLAAFPTDCEPGLYDDLSPRFRKVCALLNRMNELNMEIKEYAINEHLNHHISGLHEPGTSVKREDVDHVFLRFGKRR